MARADMYAGSDDPRFRQGIGITASTGMVTGVREFVHVPKAGVLLAVRAHNRFVAH
jgi:hypothetical protein